jgi:serine/threonine-protein kinase
MGSPHYMSPEQICESKSIDARSDLWSLGVILYRALTGELPFPGDACGLVMAKILTSPIPVPSQVAPQLGPEFDSFFRRAFERDPALRFQSAREMAEVFVAMAGAKDTVPSWPTPIHTVSLFPVMSATLPASRIAAALVRGAGGPDATMQSARQPTEPETARTMPLQPAHINNADPGGTLAATLQAVEATPTKTKVRKPLRAWGLGAGGLVGVALGMAVLATVFGSPASPGRSAPARVAQAAPLPLPAVTVAPAPEPSAPEEAKAESPAKPSDTAEPAPAASADASVQRANRPPNSPRKRPRLGF